MLVGCVDAIAWIPALVEGGLRYHMNFSPPGGISSPGGISWTPHRLVDGAWREYKKHEN